jgi:hypothetical protein
MGVACPTPLRGRFGSAVSSDKPVERWLDGLYIDQRENRDYPHRFFCW